MRPTPETDKFFATFADEEAAPSHAEYYARLPDCQCANCEFLILIDETLKSLTTNQP